MATLRQLFVDAAKPKFLPDIQARLITVLLSGDWREMGALAATALVEAVPIQLGRGMVEPLNRAATRLAYQIVRLAFPSRIVDPKTFRFMVMLSRLITRIDAELLRREAVGHRLFVNTYRDRFRAYFALANAVRDLSMLQGAPPALEGALVEHVVLAGVCETPLTGRLAASMLREAPQAERRLLTHRVETTIPAAMKNPSKVVPDEAARAAGQDLLLEAIETGAPEALSLLVAKHTCGRSLLDCAAPPSFNAALVANASFAAAAERVPRVLREYVKP